MTDKLQKTQAALTELLEKKSENDNAIRELNKTGKQIQNTIKAINKLQSTGEPRKPRRKKAASTSTE